MLIDLLRRLLGGESFLPRHLCGVRIEGGGGESGCDTNSHVPDFYTRMTLGRRKLLIVCLQQYPENNLSGVPLIHSVDKSADNTLR